MLCLPHITLSHCTGIWAILLGAAHTCGRCTGPSQEVVLQHTAPHWSCRSCPPSSWSTGDKVDPIHQHMGCALWCICRCPAKPSMASLMPCDVKGQCTKWAVPITSDLLGVQWWTLQELPYIVVLYAGHSAFHLYVTNGNIAYHWYYYWIGGTLF